MYFECGIIFVSAEGRKLLEIHLEHIFQWWREGRTYEYSKFVVEYFFEWWNTGHTVCMNTRSLCGIVFFSVAKKTEAPPALFFCTCPPARPLPPARRRVVLKDTRMI